MLRLAQWGLPVILLLWVDRLLPQLTYRADDNAAVAVLFFYPTVWDAFTIVAKGGQLGAWWRPLADASFTFDWAIAPFHAGLSFCINEIFHIGNAFLAASLMRRFKPDSPAPYILFLLVLFHPAGLQTVPMLTQRPDVAGTLFYLLALRLYLDFLGGHGKSCLGLSLLSFLAALGFKEMMMTLPAVALFVGIANARMNGRSIQKAALATGIFWLPLFAYWISRSLLVQNPLAYQHWLGEDWIIQQAARLVPLLHRSLLAVFGNTGTAQFHLAGSYLLAGGLAFAAFFVDRRRLPISGWWLLATAVSFTPVWTFADQIHPRFAYLPSILFLTGLLCALGHERGMMRPLLILALGVQPALAWSAYHMEHLQYEKRVRDQLDHQLSELNNYTESRDPETHYWILGWSPDQYFADIQRHVIALSVEVGGRASGVQFNSYLGYSTRNPLCREFYDGTDPVMVQDLGFHKVTFFGRGGGGFCMASTTPADLENLEKHPEWMPGYRFLLWQEGQYREISLEEALRWQEAGKVP